MTTRFALLELIARNKLDAGNASRLWQLAAFDRPPPALLSFIRLGMASLGAGCAGLGVIFWIAANWGLLSRFQQFALLQALVLVLCIAIAAFPKARAPLGLLTLLASGGLFAAIGQAYQTGADPWQLFALWAGLTLPLAWGVRADSLWAAWGVVALTAIALWAGPHARLSWRATEMMAGEHSIAVLLASLLTAALGRHGRRWTGAGAWTFGITLVMASAFVTTMALADLLNDSSMCYWVSLVLFASLAAMLAQQQTFDVLAASVAGLSINVLLVFGLGVVLFENAHSAVVFPLLVLGLAAAGLLALTVKLIIDGTRQPGVTGEAA